MVMIGSSLICVVTRRGVTGLAYSVPWLIIFIEGKVFRPLLENRKVKSPLNVPRFFPNETQVSCFHISVGICGRFRTVGIVTGPAINDSVPTVYQVIAHTAHACCLPTRTVAAFAYGLLLFTPGNVNLQYATLGDKIMVILVEMNTILNKYYV
jgi:hypothetical protein